MDSRDELKRQRVAKKLGKAFTLTRMFEDHSADARDYLTSVIEKQHLGKPIAAYFYSSEKWTMLTTSHLAWKHRGSSHCHRFTDIDRPDYSQETKKQILLDNSMKARVESLEVKTKDGNTYVIPLEPGIALYRFWRAINLFVGTRFGRQST